MLSVQEWLTSHRAEWAGWTSSNNISDSQSDKYRILLGQMVRDGVRLPPRMTIELLTSEIAIVRQAHRQAYLRTTKGIV